MPIPQKSILKITLTVVVLGLFYVALFMLPKGTRRTNSTPDESRALLEKSKTLLKSDKYEEALAPAQKLYQAQPANPIYIEQVAVIYDRLHRYEEEAGLWEQYRQHASRPITACPQIGQAYQKQGKLKEAIAAYEWCLSLSPDDTDQVFNLAHALERTGEWDRSAELYRKGLKISPDNGDLRIGLARVLIHLDQPAQAREEAAKVLEKSPDNSDALFALGMAYYGTYILNSLSPYVSSA